MIIASELADAVESTGDPLIQCSQQMVMWTSPMRVGLVIPQ
ncbi:MAG: hypothetical protein O6941_02180 [Planctomycetota bacterium]|nr:hypothetical protein [Planctomycetota bacterium]MCZ6492997.1 hypothetical protein [Planctomycetota bacterium]MCZ6611416.1 hypothetical protein [Planctomycetota bacterium]MCZ6735390.1 hypothetical protein [Planctomycetota bacterium]MCZ6851070.1 hypothetical protein [Planctomycetota bacterium]